MTCGDPAVGKWHEQDDEWFCAAHMGDPDAGRAKAICPRCFSHVDYSAHDDDPEPRCDSCDWPLLGPSVHGYRDGDQVHDTRDGSTGTVRIFPLGEEAVAGVDYDRSDIVNQDSAGRLVTAEIQWHGSFVVTELDLAMPHIEILSTAD
jgi:hypothetical protein